MEWKRENCRYYECNMRKLLFYFLFLLRLVSEVDGQDKTLPSANNTSFSYGEDITYKLTYSLYMDVSVGEVNFKIMPKPEDIKGNRCMHIVATGNTYPFYDPFYTVRDRYESYIDEKSLLPFVFMRNVHEGDFKFNDFVVFNPFSNIAKSKKRTQHIPSGTWDMLSILYYARTLNYANAKPGQKFTMHTFIDDSTYTVGVKYIGKETVKTDMGTFRCIKLQPILIVGHVFKSDSDMMLWISDDNNHIPVQVESGISVGAVKAQISKYSGLKNSMTAKL